MKTWIHSGCLLLALSSGTAWAEVVNINTANADELATAISGVGPKTAQAIVQYRTLHGPFRSVDDLVQVKGVGPSTIDKNRAILSVGEQFPRSTKQE